MKAADKIGVYPTTVVKSTEVTVYRVMIGECQLRFESEHLDDAQIFADGLRARQLANERKAADQPSPTPVPPEEQPARIVECSEGCPFCSGESCINHGDRACVCDTVDRHFVQKAQPASAGPQHSPGHVDCPGCDENEDRAEWLEREQSARNAQLSSTEPKGADVAAEECEDLLIEEGDPLDSISCFGCNSRVRKAFHRGESRAFARIRETAISIAQADFYQTESRVNWLHRVLDEAARRLGIKP